MPIQSTGPIDLPTTSAPPTVSRWLPRYVAALLALDTLGLMLGGIAGRLLRFETLSGDLSLGPQFAEVAYRDVLLAAAPFWLLAMATARAYEGRYLGLGSEEFRRVGNAAVRFTALVAVTIFLFKWDVARGLIVFTLPAAAAFTLAFRYLARKVLHKAREDGSASHRVLVVGDGEARDELVRKLRAAPYSGLQVVGVCRPTRPGSQGVASMDHLRSMVESLNADTVAVAHSPLVSPSVLRELAWSLEGNGVSLLVAPALTDVAGPRVSIRPVSGLPLLLVAEPEFTGIRRLVKGTIDLTAAVIGLLVISPLLAGIALAVRLSSPGPVLFKQIRIGKDGKEFVIYRACG